MAKKPAMNRQMRKQFPGWILILVLVAALQGQEHQHQHGDKGPEKKSRDWVCYIGDDHRGSMKSRFDGGCPTRGDQKIGGGKDFRGSSFDNIQSRSLRFLGVNIGRACDDKPCVRNLFSNEFRDSLHSGKEALKLF